MGGSRASRSESEGSESLHGGRSTQARAEATVEAEGESFVGLGAQGARPWELRDVAQSSPQVGHVTGLQGVVQRSPQVQRSAELQRLAQQPAEPARVRAQAREGVRGPGSELPHLTALQRSFGPYALGGVRAYTGPAAQRASQSIGAQAYATQGKIAFASSSPTLHTAAHEAAHVVQQRGGVQLQGGVGSEHDEYERHADEVADAVVRGASAVSLLDRYGCRGIPPGGPGDSGGSGSGSGGLGESGTDVGVQRKMGLEFELTRGFNPGEVLEFEVVKHEKDKLERGAKPKRTALELEAMRHNTPSSGRMIGWNHATETYDWSPTSTEGNRSHGRLLYEPEEGGWVAELDGDHIEFITSAVNETETGYQRLLEITEAMYDKMEEWHSQRYAHFFPAEKRIETPLMYRWRSSGGVSAVPHATVGVDLTKMTQFLSSLAPDPGELEKKRLEHSGSMGFSRGADKKGLIQAQAMQRMQSVYRALLADDELLDSAKGYLSLVLTDVACLYYVKKVKFAKDILAVMHRTRLSDLYYTLSKKAVQQVKWALLSPKSPIRALMLGELSGTQRVTTTTKSDGPLPLRMRSMTVQQALILLAKGTDIFADTATARHQLSFLSRETMHMPVSGKTWQEQFHIENPTDVGTGTDENKDPQRSGAIVELRRPPICHNKQDWLRIPKNLADTMRGLQNPTKLEPLKDELPPVLEARAKEPKKKLQNVWKDLRLPTIPSSKPTSKKKLGKQKLGQKEDNKESSVISVGSHEHEESSHEPRPVTSREARVLEVVHGLSHNLGEDDRLRVIAAIGLETIEEIGSGLVGLVCARAIAAGMSDLGSLRKIETLAKRNLKVWEFLEDMAIAGRIDVAFLPLAIPNEMNTEWGATVSEGLIDAYLADLPERSAYLDEVEGEALARAMNLHATIFSEVDGHESHWFYDEQTGDYYEEVSETAADGNCLIHGMYHILRGTNAEPIEIRDARRAIGSHVDRGLLRHQIESYVAARIAGEHVAGLGIRFRAMLEADPSIRRADVSRHEQEKKKESSLLMMKDESSKISSLGSLDISVLSKPMDSKPMDSKPVQPKKKQLPSFSSPGHYQRIRRVQTYGAPQHSEERNGFLIHVGGNHYIHVVKRGTLLLEEESLEDNNVELNPSKESKESKAPKLKAKKVQVSKHHKRKRKRKHDRKPPFSLLRQGTLARVDIGFSSHELTTQREVRGILQGLAPHTVLSSRRDLDEFVIHWARRVFAGEFGSIEACEKEVFHGSNTSELILRLKRAIKKSH